MRRSRISIFSALVVGAVLAPATPALAGGDVTVMTRNLYLGADIIQLALPKTKNEFKKKATGMWKTVQKTNFPKRAPALAREIKAAKPDLVGLQEASMWRTGPAGSPKPARKVKYDFTKELRSALKKQGIEYTVVVTQDEFDYEAPINGADVRLTQRDVILKRKSGSKVTTGATSRGQYSAANTLVVPTAVGPADSVRGWVAVDASIGGTDFKFVNTHFEAYGDKKTGQSLELVGPGGPLADTAKPAVLLGDFNSGPAQAGASGDAYRNVIGAGFNNIWGTQTDIRTIGRDELLAKQTDNEFIDQITYRPLESFTVKSMKVVGDSAFSRSIPKWSSDHNGVVATLTVK